MEGNVSIMPIAQKDILQIYDAGRTEQYFCGFWEKDILKKLVDSTDSYVPVARYDGELAGFGIVSYNNTLSKGVIENLYVASPFRGKRINNSCIAHILLQDILTNASHRNISRLDGLIDSTNKASINIARKSGFETSQNQYSWVTRYLR